MCILHIPTPETPSASWGQSQLGADITPIAPGRPLRFLPKGIIQIFHLVNFGIWSGEHSVILAQRHCLTSDQALLVLVPQPQFSADCRRAIWHETMGPNTNLEVTCCPTICLEWCCSSFCLLWWQGYSVPQFVLISPSQIYILFSFIFLKILEQLYFKGF